VPVLATGVVVVDVVACPEHLMRGNARRTGERGPRVDPPGRARRISPGVSQPETAISQGQPDAGALEPEPGPRRRDSGFRRP
jgi:hypothetical protein